MAFAEDEFVPFRYVVEETSSTVTFWPADVVIVKLDAETLSTVPDAPPVAGPDRALDAPPEPIAPTTLPAAAGVAVVVERDATRPTESPITAHTSAAATAIRRRLLFASNRRNVGRVGLAMGSVVVLDKGRPEKFW
jgi:hypothetical protein